MKQQIFLAPLKQMSKQEKPKRQQARLIKLSKKSSWRKIIKEVEKKEVPIHVLEKIVVLLKDGTEVPVNIKELLSNGADPDIVEKELNTKLESLELYIQNVNFYIDIDQIEKTVQQETDRILNKFKL
jgi:hypothetical protein